MVNTWYCHTSIKNICFQPCGSYYIVWAITTWWRHETQTFSAILALCAGNSPATGKFPSQRPVTRSLDVSLTWAWTNGWVTNRDAGGLRRHVAPYDVTVMCCATVVDHHQPWQPATRGCQFLFYHQCELIIPTNPAMMNRHAESSSLTPPWWSESVRTNRWVWYHII